MARDFEGKSINCQAALGLSYGRGEPRYTGEVKLAGNPEEHVLTFARQIELRREIAEEGKARNEKNRARKARRKARKLAQGSSEKTNG